MNTTESPSVRDYVGSELELFAAAVNWKAYVYAQVAPFLGARVLEVGAGIGTTTRALCRGRHERWICLEPDPEQTQRIADSIAQGSLPSVCEARQGVLGETATSPEFDSVLYMDVLEHIEDDRRQLELAAESLVPGGHLVVLAPAHQALYSEFDRGVGHYRRYDRTSLLAAFPPGRIVCARYLDSFGLLASIGNRFLLRSGMPTAKQILTWDRVLVRVSRALDPALRYRVGKSVLAVWRRA